MNKGVLVFLILCITAPVFAQESNEPIRVEVVMVDREAENAVFLDIGPMLLGLFLGGFGVSVGYERAMADNYSLMGKFAYLGVDQPFGTDVSFVMTGLSFSARYYPLRSAVNRLFLDATVGFNYANFKGTVTEWDDDWNSNEVKKDESAFLVEFVPSVGWKWINRNGFFFELGFGYPLRIGKGPLDLLINESDGLGQSGSNMKWIVSWGWVF